MKAVIMAGGKGTRIRSITEDIPKPMILVAGKPVLEHQIINLQRYGITQITLVVGHLKEKIVNYFGDGSTWNVNINYFYEKEPLGTAGALYELNDLNEDFLLLCGDTIFDIDFNRFISFHKLKKGLCSLVAHPNDHPYDSALIEIADYKSNEFIDTKIKPDRLLSWSNKEDKRDIYRNLVNAGIEIISPELLKKTRAFYEDSKIKFDLDRDILKPSVNNSDIYVYCTPEYIKDMGTPDRFEKVNNDMINGIVAKKNLSKKQKAIFLDRDGTINKKNGFISDQNQIELLQGVANAIKKINASEYLAIVITNQPVVARGECSFSNLRNIHNMLETLLGREGAYIDDILFCPHHPDKGFKGEVKELKIECNCRKPKPGLLIEASKKYNIDLTESFMIGDSNSDVDAGQSVGCKSFKIETDSDINKIIDQIIK